MTACCEMNTRVLVIDDEEGIRNGIRDILRGAEAGAAQAAVAEMDAAAMALFDQPQPVAPSAMQSEGAIAFTVDTAACGRDGFAMVREAVDRGSPYAVAFVDMRMPGWDGLETVQHIRSLDKRMEIFFVTAYSDRSIDEIVSKAGANVGYRCKPFSPQEIHQLAVKGVYDWNRLRDLERLMDHLALLRSDGGDVRKMLGNIHRQVTEILGSESVLVSEVGEGGVRVLFASGVLADEHNASGILDDVRRRGGLDRVVQTAEYFSFPVDGYLVVTILTRGSAVGMEKMYIISLFAESAARAVRNARLQEELLRKEKLANLGLAIRCLAHDIRSPLSNVCAAAEILDEDRKAGAPPEPGMLHVIRNSAHNTMTLVQDVLDYTNGKAPVIGLHRVDELVEQMKLNCGFALGERLVSLETGFEDGLAFSFDFNKLLRVVSNLVNNAKSVLLEHRTPSPAIRVVFRRNGPLMEIRVCDNGPGIPEPVLRDMFKSHISMRRGGTGLGLSIAKHFVDLHRGAIAVERTGPDGTVMLVSVPFDGPEAVPLPTAPPSVRTSSMDADTVAVAGRA